MLGLMIPYVIGLLLGVPLGLFYPRIRRRSIVYRLGVGLLAGVGVALAINGALELFDFVGLTTETPS